MRLWIALPFASALLACADSPPALGVPGKVVELRSPAGPESGEPFLSVARDGSVLLSWIERRDALHELRFARLRGETWSEPRTIAASSALLVNWADFPSILEAADGRLAAHWLVRSGPGGYAYDAWIAFSGDGGASWSRPVKPHRDESDNEHGFVSLFPTGSGIGAVWLDGRELAGAEGGGHEHGGQTALRYTAFAATGEPGDDTRIDARACDCCQTDAAITAAGPIVAYRDRSPDEVRDVVVTRLADGRWTEPKPVHVDRWVLDACPVNGPALATSGSRVALAWFTAAQGVAKIQVAFSDDSGETFGTPTRLDLGDPSGRVDVALLEDGTAIAIWLERSEAGAHLLGRRAGPDGSSSESFAVGAASSERGGGFPRLVRAGARLIFAWTESGGPAAVRVAAAPVPSG